VNLLAEWAQTRQSGRLATRRVTLCLVLLGIIAAAAIPPLKNMRQSSAAKVAEAAKNFAAADAALQSVAREQKDALPRLDNEALKTTLRRRSRLFLGQTVLLLNSAPTGLAIEALSSDVIGGEQTIRVKADAETGSVAELFASEASLGPKKLSAVVVNSRESDRLRKGGVAFEFVKKVEVGP